MTAGAPTASYDAAIAAFRAVEADEAGLPLHARCRSALLTHGGKTDLVVVYFHGFTTCPAQGSALAARLHAMGCNVYLPRMFGHGGADPSTLLMTGLTTRHLIDHANGAVDIARGLGEEVVVVGLSAGGTVAAWAAQFRAEIHKAVCVSPFFGPYVLPPWAVGAAGDLTLSLPNVVLRWNPLSRPVPDGVDYPFALAATHAFAAFMRLGRMVESAARAAPAAARGIGVIINEADLMVSNAATRHVVALWCGHGEEVALDVLPRRHRLPHDIINPFERNADVDLVYGRVIEMILGAPAAPEAGSGGRDA